METEQTAEGIKDLKACLNDLITVLALPAIWSNHEPSQIVNTLLEALVGMLRLDFAYVRLSDSFGNGAPIEMVRLAQPRNLTLQPQEIGQALTPWFGDGPHTSPLVVPNPVGEGEVSIAAFRLGLQDEVGILVAGSRRGDFPTEVERLLLRVTANQAAVGLQEAHLLGEQRRVAEELEQRVVERTRQLAAVNEDLRKEIIERKRAEEALRESEEQWRAVFEHNPTMYFMVDAAGTVLSVNPFGAAQLGYTVNELVGHSVLNVFYEADRDAVQRNVAICLEHLGQSMSWEFRKVRKDGTVFWVRETAKAVLRGKDQPIILIVCEDITERKRTERLLAVENQLLEMIAKGNPLSSILDALCRFVEETAAGSLCSILLLDSDGERLRHGAAPSLPTSYTGAIDGSCIGPCAGSCGTAAYRREAVIVSDITTDPLWADYRDLASTYGLRACWSTPILSSDASVLGTFAIYWREPRNPSSQQQNMIELFSHLASIAIERKQAEEKLRQDERELRRITDAIPQLICVLGPDGKVLYANQLVLDYSGLNPEDVMADDFRARLFHPDDLERVRDERQNALVCGIPFELELRARRKDGQYRWFLIRYNPLRDEQGSIIRWYATGTDIEDRKQTEERVQRENLALREEIDHSLMFEEIVGSSEALRKVLAQVAKVASADTTVLILGETGTGKELIARAIHKRSNRSSRAFIRVNCAVIPPSLIASELFGHERGAFTGASQRRLGRFELADHGTIFLDEIGELPAETQLALLRVLQEREIERVGGSRPIPVDVRVLAATNRDLKAAMAAGTFRQDLFYRLSVFPIQIPSLRERVDDIPLLVEYLIERYAKKAGKKIWDIRKQTLELFQAYDWPGNIRELQNVIERAVVLCESETFYVDETWLKGEPARQAGPAVPLAATIAEREREMIEAALAQSQGQVSGPTGAAAKLGIPRQTLDSKIKSLGIDKHRFTSRST